MLGFLSNKGTSSRATVARNNIVLVTSLVWVGLMLILPLNKTDMFYMYWLLRAVLALEIQQDLFQRALVYYITWGFFTQTSLSFSVANTIMPFHYRVALVLSFGCTLYVFQQITFLKNLLTHFQFYLGLVFFCPLSNDSVFSFTRYSLVGVTALLVALSLNQRKYEHYIFHYVRAITQDLFQPLKALLLKRDYSNEAVMTYKANSMDYLETQKYSELNANNNQHNILDLYYRTMRSVINGNYQLLLNYNHLLKTKDSNLINLTRKTDVLKLIMETLFISGKMIAVTSKEFSRRIHLIQEMITNIYTMLDTKISFTYTLRIYEILITSGSILIQLERLEPLLRNL
jgi:hypothetical protein